MREIQLKKITDLIISKLENFKKGECKTWVNPALNLPPQNFVTKREYNGINKYLLMLENSISNYQTPFYLTFNQASEIGLKILKGSKSSEILHYKPYYYNSKDKKRITLEEYQELTKEQKKAFFFCPNMKLFRVFNIEQTDIKESNPEEWEKALKLSQKEDIEIEKERLLNNDFLNDIPNNWICPINIKETSRAFFSPTSNFIEVPQKSQYADEYMFYSVLLHEITHSTGKPLERDLKGYYEDNEAYAKEELIAELGSVFIALSLGLECEVQESNITYLNSWLNAIKEEPSFLLETMQQASKATDFFFERTQKIA